MHADHRLFLGGGRKGRIRLSVASGFRSEQPRVLVRGAGGGRYGERDSGETGEQSGARPASHPPPDRPRPASGQAIFARWTNVPLLGKSPPTARRSQAFDL